MGEWQWSGGLRWSAAGTVGVLLLVMACAPASAERKPAQGATLTHEAGVAAQADAGAVPDAGRAGRHARGCPECGQGQECTPLGTCAPVCPEGQLRCCDGQCGTRTQCQQTVCDPRPQPPAEEQ